MTVNRISVATVGNPINSESPNIGVPKPTPSRCSLRTALKPLIFISKANGFAPLTLGPTGPPEKSCLGYSIMFTAIVTVTEYIALSVELSRPTQWPLYKVAFLAIFSINRICAVVNHFVILTHRSNLVAAIGRLVQLDDEWHPSRIHGIMVPTCLQLAALYLIIISDAATSHIFNRSGSLSTFALYCLQTFITGTSICLPLLQWSPLVQYLGLLMDTLKAELFKLYPISKDWFSENRRSSFGDSWSGSILVEDIESDRDTRHALKQTHAAEITVPSNSILRLRKLHLGTYAALQKLQTVYGIPLTIAVALHILNVVTTIFYLQYEWSTFEVLWMLWTCWITCMAQTCADVLHTILQSNLHREERKQLLDFSVQMLDLPLSCTACNFFELDNGRLISILGTIITYVIILTQFNTLELCDNTEVEWSNSSLNKSL